jgi:hypothetical protein
MRLLPIALALVLLAGCGNKVDHPDAAPGCDPDVQDCLYMPGETGGMPLPGGGGSSSNGRGLVDLEGQVFAFQDDYFDAGSVYNGTANISATGLSGARVKGTYDGTTFQLRNVLKAGDNWFLVEPDENVGVLPTVTVVDTRATKTDEYAIGLVRRPDIEGIFQLSLTGEPSSERAQVVLRLVDDQNRSVPGVRAQFTAEVVAYRAQDTWDATDEGETDDSGLIFLGNVPATPTLTTATVALTGTVSARVEIRTLAGATTVVNAIVDAP